MDYNASGDDIDIDWNTDDEWEIQNIPSSSCPNFQNPCRKAIANHAEASSSSTGPMIDDFIRMGFPERLVLKAIKDNDDGKPEAILETLLTYSALEDSPLQEDELERQQGGHATFDSDKSSSNYLDNPLYDLSDSDGWPGDEKETTKSLPPSLTDMGYTEEEVSIAMDRCGPGASIDELADFICAAQIARAANYDLQEQKPKLKKRSSETEILRRKKLRVSGTEDCEMVRLPNPMIGFGIKRNMSLPPEAIGPPYFYFENVALAPKGCWDSIKRFLYGVDPEFVDSKHFCAAARKRGYVHNLPVENRFHVLPLPPQTIQEALPPTKTWWPKWDTRTKFNCLQTCIASAENTKRIRKSLEDNDGDPPDEVKKYVMEECRKWNLVWVGKNKVAPLECDEVELLLGFPRDHTRGGGVSRTDRYKSLGNSFQVDTVAYHFSVLKDLYRDGIKVLSLFSGIGGAEVALHRLGIPLKIVVSVEKSEVNRHIVRSWWEQTYQQGELEEFNDVKQLDDDLIEKLVLLVGGFDLVVGGSPCNNLTGSNRHHRDGLEGKESELFYDYFRILDSVRRIMGKQQR